VQDFAAQGLLKRERSAIDARRIALSLTAEGRKAFRTLDRRSSRVTARMLAALSGFQRDRLVAAIDVLQRTLAAPSAPDAARVTVRPHGIGDCGWAIEQHGRVYAQEFGWNREFEAMVAGLFARFASGHDPVREQFWIAEVDGERVGCVFVVRSEADPAAAQLRCLLVTPAGRGLGVGRRLVDTCIEFARSAGYCTIVLWTNDVLVSARRIYEAVGFSLVEQSRHHSFGRDLVGQTWSLDLLPGLSAERADRVS
jgi:GNAT superfamily N-acetyltransferase